MMNGEYKKGLKALQVLLKTGKDQKNAFNRPDIGNITLIYGTPGKPDKNFKPGYGIAHIIAKRDHEKKAGNNTPGGIETVKKLIEVIIYGKITKSVKTKQTVFIQKDGYEAILSLDWHGESVTWLVTGYKIMK